VGRGVDLGLELALEGDLAVAAGIGGSLLVGAGELLINKSWLRTESIIWHILWERSSLIRKIPGHTREPLEIISRTEFPLDLQLSCRRQ
jgi:hypothetical protein